MAHRRKKSHRRRKKASNNMVWIAGGVVSIVMVIVAFVLLSGDDETSGQKSFDPNFLPEVTGAPRVEVLPGDTVDYGDVRMGTTITTTYTVRNVGDEPLEILDEPRVELMEGC